MLEPQNPPLEESESKYIRLRRASVKQALRNHRGEVPEIDLEGFKLMGLRELTSALFATDPNWRQTQMGHKRNASATAAANLSTGHQVALSKGGEARLERGELVWEVGVGSNNIV